MPSIDNIVSEQLLPGRLTRNERSELLNEFLSRPPEDDERRLPPNITHDNYLFYYPDLGVTFNDWNDRRHLVSLTVNLSIVSRNFSF